MTTASPYAGPAPHPAPRPRPSRAGYWIGGLVVVAGIIIAIAVAVSTVLGVGDRIDRLPRTSLPGEVAVEVSEPGTRVLYFESDGPDRRLVTLGIRVTAPDGTDVPVRPMEGTVVVDVPARSTTAHAVGSFSAADAGTYVVSSDAAAPGSTLAVGESETWRVLLPLAAAGAVFLLSVGGGATLMIVTLVRRSSRAAAA